MGMVTVAEARRKDVGSSKTAAKDIAGYAHDHWQSCGGFLIDWQILLLKNQDRSGTENCTLNTIAGP